MDLLQSSFLPEKHYSRACQAENVSSPSLHFAFYSKSCSADPESHGPVSSTYFRRACKLLQMMMEITRVSTDTPVGTNANGAVDTEALVGQVCSSKHASRSSHVNVHFRICLISPPLRSGYVGSRGVLRSEQTPGRSMRIVIAPIDADVFSHSP